MPDHEMAQLVSASVSLLRASCPHVFSSNEPWELGGQFCLHCGVSKERLARLALAPQQHRESNRG